MKTAKRVLSLAICLIMIASSIFIEGIYNPVLESVKASAIAGYEQSYNDARVELDFNKGWSFALTDDSAAYLKGFDDSDWEQVDLPHDFSISQDFTTEGTEAESGNLPGGTGWYRKWFNLYEYYTGDCITIDFGGAYQHAYVYVNGKYVGENHYGYNSFSFEISDYLICSNTSLNLIAVKVVNDIPSSRWYSGSGLYRDVTLTIKGPVHVSLYGPQITTPGIANGDGTVQAAVTMHNDTAISKKVTVETTVLDKNNNPVSGTEVSSLVTVPAQTEKTVILEPSVSSPVLWSPENPYLYKLKTVIRNEEGELIDEYHTTFGYRYINWDANNGFSLNGEYVKLKGVCLHHDQGALGAVQEREALYRQLIILKDMGCNAIRTSHNSASRVLIDLCNELGILVMEEFFDGWDVSKDANVNGFNKYFLEEIPSTSSAIGAHGQKWFEFVVEQTILRDRHDPCIIAWGVGNELSSIDITSTPNYQAIVESIVDIRDELDPSRVLLQGNNNASSAANEMVDAHMDVVGANYAPEGWLYVLSNPDDSRYGKPLVATEAASSINSRGVYDTMSYYDFQCSSYDTNAVSWGNEAAEAWYSVITNDNFSGEFVWTGFDYIGEPTPWNDLVNPNANSVPNSSYFGIVDTAGFAKDSYYLYRSLWNEDSTTLHLVPGSWNSDKLLLNNGYVNVAVYSNAKKIELLLNGNVIATATSTITTTDGGHSYRTWTESITDSANCSVGSFYTGNGEDFYPQFSVKYAEGTLSVKAYDENNAEITDTVGSVKSVSGDATQVVLSTWQNKDTFVADGADFIYVEFEARDADGNFMNDYNGTINVKVDDYSARYAKIVGVDNGNAATTEKFQQSSVLVSDSEANIKMFNGRALAILKTTEEEGTINLTAIASEGTTSFSTQGITVTSETETGVELTDEFEEVVIQNDDKYEVTLYDEYEMTKHHISELEPPVNDGSGGSGGSGGESSNLKNFEIYLPGSTDEGSIADGDYVIFNQNTLMSTESFWDYTFKADTNIESAVAPESGSHPYDSFDASESNIYTFTHKSGNEYYIQNKNGQYITLGVDGVNSGFNIVNSTEPKSVNVVARDNGSIVIYSPDYYICHYSTSNHFYVALHSEVQGAGFNSNYVMWLYTPKPEEPVEPLPTVDPDKFVLHLADTDASEKCIPSGEYVLNVKDCVMADEQLADWGNMQIDKAITVIEWAVSGSPYYYMSFDTSSDNIYVFTHQGGDQYYIQHKNSGQYLNTIGWCPGFSSEPLAFHVEANDNGSVQIYTYINGTRITFFQEWEYFCLRTAESDGNTGIWLYSPEYPASETPPEGGDDEGGNEDGNSIYADKKALFDILHEGIKYDYSAYVRDSYEDLLDALENGVAVYKNSDATAVELKAATEAIRDAIDALALDVKKIDGTLFKYGYNNSTGTADYSEGGLLMNDIAVRQMKTAILADANLVNQIKEIIGYDDIVASGNAARADEVLEEAAELYAKIYTLQFTGETYNGSNIGESPNGYQYISADTKIPLTLWNVWTKDNTHGADDPVLYGEPVHDGASVQGLAGATLDNSVITSHSAYTDELPYSNDGPGEMYDVTEYTYGFPIGSGYKSVTLKPLSGISVYFPDLFTKEALDANGNVTTATSGRYSKYYWDTQFPMFISTDEYGVNTYHYDSKNTNYLVQTSFNDAEHTAEMELNEVGDWDANGPHSGSGFFPFNYKNGTTTYTDENAVYHYGFTFEHNFYIPKGGKHLNGDDVVFEFSGDDDVYVYIDGVLVLDNGGLHGARAVTINFTTCSITYQYAMDVTDGQLKGGEYETTYSYNEYIENPDATGYNADTIAAINKLHEVISDGEVHTLNFFYLERGASDSNCKISFNLSETSEDVRIIDQNLTLDYGLPVEYNIKDNNNISQAAIDNGVEVEYLGLCAVNAEYAPTYTFEKPIITVPFEEGVTYTIEGMKYGTCTIDKEGNTSYVPKSMNMSKSENYYVVAKITGDPTYAEEVVYYQIEKTTFIPATAIYYEDTFETLTYTNGKVPSNYDNSVNEYGLWKTDGMQPTTLKQTADLTDSEANPYGYETGYSSFAEYSGNSSHYVDVSTKNNPNKKYSGGTGAAWPTVDFTFTGTGFDLISVTDNTTGAFSVLIKDAENRTVSNTVVDTFYGYNYGRIYADAEGKPTLDSSNTVMYKSENGTCTSDARYYDENGAITDVAHYYDENGAITEVAHYYDENGAVVETQTDMPACSYAFAYGWVIAESGTTDTLYQIPVIKITDLPYGNYSVQITPTFTSAFRHSSTAADGTSYYRVYLDAIKIYSPAGESDDIKDADVKKAYATDDELYPSYLELKDMLIGADSLSESEGQGVIFIDGIAALDNDIETYKNAGPNNELYLAKNQAVAFEIWATSVPTDVQLGAKLACGNPVLTVSYASKTTDLDITTATDIYYSLNTLLPNDAKLTWQLVEGSDGNNYYTTGTVVIQNTGDEDSILSVTNLKWTFSQNGGKGYFRIPTPVEDETLTLASTSDTPAAAYSLMRMRTAALDVEQTQEPEVSTDSQGNSSVVLKLKTSAEVESLVVTDENGNPIDPKNVEFTSSQVEGENAVEWTVTIAADKAGTYTYTVAGAYANGYTDYSKAVSFTVTVEEPPADDQPGDEPDDPNEKPDNPSDGPDEPGEDPGDGSDSAFIDFLRSAYNTIVNFMKTVLELFGTIF